MTTSNKNNNNKKVGGILDELTLKGGKLEQHSRKIIHFQYETKVRSGVEYTESRSNTRAEQPRDE